MRLVGFPSILTLCFSALMPSLAWAQLAPYQVIHPLAGSEGAGPQSGLVRGADDRLYGTATNGGGPDGAGTIYRIAANGTFRVIYRFLTTSPGGGLDPVSLIRGRDKNLYGTTEYGGTLDDGSTVDADGNPAGDGVIYRLNWNATRRTYEGITILHTFDCSKGEGGDPWGSMVEGPDGALYGVTAPADWPDPNCTDPTAVYKINKDGTGFRIDESGNFTSLYKFDPLSINIPYSPLVVGGDGKLYGAAHYGGSADAGGSYIFDPPAPIGLGGGFTLHSTFDHFTTGSFPWGPLGVGVDRHLYGTQSGGGASDQGTLFGLLNIDVVDRPPVPYVIASPNPAEAQTAAGAAVSLSALGSWDADFDDLTYSWVLPPQATLISEAPDQSTLEARFPIVPPIHDVTLSVSDGVSTRSVTKTITVFDAPPILGTVAPISKVAATTAGTVVTYTPPTATDVVDVTVPVTCAPPSGSTFLVGATTVVCSATDSAENTETTSFVVTVTLDTTPPVLTLPIGIIAEATGPSGAEVTYSWSASDNLGIAVESCSPPSGSVFPIASTTVSCMATDFAKLTTYGRFIVLVEDTTGPVVTVPANMVVVSLTGTIVTYPAATALDLVNGVTAASCTPLSGSVFPVGVTTVTCLSSDSRGNPGSNSFTVTVATKLPTLKVTLSPGVLWPPNHKLVTITATVDATPEAGPADVILMSIRSNEPDNGLGDGDTVNDIQEADYGTNDRVFRLRAERSAKGKGRVYTVTYKAVFQSNPNIVVITTATATVPHAMSGKKQ